MLIGSEPHQYGAPEQHPAQHVASLCSSLQIRLQVSGVLSQEQRSGQNPNPAGRSQSKPPGIQFRASRANSNEASKKVSSQARLARSKHPYQVCDGHEKAWTSEEPQFAPREPSLSQSLILFI